MVAVVQLVEHQVVILVVAGSSPVSHPKLPSPALGIFYISTTISSERGLNDKTCCFSACRVKRHFVLVGVGV